MIEGNHTNENSNHRVDFSFIITSNKTTTTTSKIPMAEDKGVKILIQDASSSSETGKVGTTLIQPTMDNAPSYAQVVKHGQVSVWDKTSLVFTLFAGRRIYSNG